MYKLIFTNNVLTLTLKFPNSNILDMLCKETTLRVFSILEFEKELNDLLRNKPFRKEDGDLMGLVFGIANYMDNKGYSPTITMECKNEAEREASLPPE